MAKQDLSKIKIWLVCKACGKKHNASNQEPTVNECVDCGSKNFAVQMTGLLESWEGQE